MKKIIVCLLSILMLAGVLTACSNTPDEKQDKLSVVCTIFPEYDWVTQILGSHAKNADVTMLLDKGVDLHSYQPTADDIIKLSTCDMFIYVGGESDAWVESALKEATNKKMIVINLLDVLGNAVKEEVVKEGMEAEEEQEHIEEEEEPEYDEHVWLSLKNAAVLSREIANQLAAVDPDNAEIYLSNTDTYIEKLSYLDTQYQSAVDSAEKKTVLFGDRFPFRYLVDDYGLDYYAAFVGCSAETEASFETIAFLSGKVDELGLSYVMTIEGAQHKIAQTVIQNTKDKNQKVIVMDSMQSATSKDVKNGTTYLSIMTENLNALKTALS